jgi:hypothetical protein
MSEKPAPKFEGRLFQLNPDAILSLVVFGVAAAAQDPETPASDSLLIVTFSIIALFVAHVFAQTLAGHGIKGGEVVGVRQAFGIAIRNALSMFIWVLPASVPLVLGAAGLLTADQAGLYALILMFAGLFVFGFLVFYARHSRWYTCLLGSLATGLIGILVVAIELLARFLHGPA